MCEDFVLLASGTSLDVVCDPFFHFRPPVSLLCFLKSFVPTWVSRCWVVMHEGHDASLYFEDRGYDDLSFRVYGGRCCHEFAFREYCDILVVSFASVSPRRS